MLDKRCARCKWIKPIDQFYNMTKHPDGKDSYCKKCRHEVTADYEKKLSPDKLALRKAKKHASYQRLKEERNPKVTVISHEVIEALPI